MNINGEAIMQSNIGFKEMSKNIKPATLEDLEKWADESKRLIEKERLHEKMNRYLEKTPLRYRNKTFDDFKVKTKHQARIKNIIMRFVSTFDERVFEGITLLFQGMSLTGKTFLAHIIDQTLTRNGFRIKHEASLEFIKKLLEIKFKSQKYFDYELEQLNQHHLLIIDEVTESITRDGKPSEIEKQVLFKILNDRYENNLCTLVITNRRTDELFDRLGTGILDRLTDKGISLIFNGDSYKQQ